MDKCIFNDSNGLWYELVGNYYLSCVKIPEEEQRPVEVWGQRHLRYIRQDKRVQEMYLRLVVQMAEREGVTEQLKADNQMSKGTTFHTT